MTNEGSGLDVTAREYAGGQKVFGRYTLRKVLGRGGMGIVWLARDEELERDVALKFLPDLVVMDKALVSELKRETRRSLELTHKNIVRIYDFVQSENSACISMEYIDGDTLSNLRAAKEQKVFQPEEIAAWTSQLCDALDYAHNHARIIHRDLKPANLMVNQKGNLKVSDFGIARSLGDSMSKLTMASGTSGTLVYMSPQQFDGERGTHLDDIYSLGATLYDLLTSKPPFYSGNLDKQIHERVAPSMTERRKEFNIEPALVPPIWEQTVAACLAKNPARRPQSTMEVAERLQLGPPQTRTLPRIPAKGSNWKLLLGAGVAALLLLAFAGMYLLKQKDSRSLAGSSPVIALAAAVPEKSIAVLPFENLSSEQENAFFANGVQDEILNNLAKIADLKVISRTSVMHYKTGAARNLREIAKSLGVAHVLEGSVQRVGGRVRVNAQLIDARSDTHRWAEKYDRELANVFEIQSEIAQAIVAKLKSALSPAEKGSIEQRPTHDLEAYDLYLQGKELVRETNPTSDPKAGEKYSAAIAFLEKAVGRDPKFALAYCLLSEANLSILWSVDQDPVYRSRAEMALQAALRLAPNAGETHLAQAHFFYYGKRDYDHALEKLELAAHALPNNADVLRLTARVERRLGRWTEAVRHYMKLIELDPRDAGARSGACLTYKMMRRYADAIRVADRAIVDFPERADEFRVDKSGAALNQGDTKAARAALEGTSPNNFRAIGVRFWIALYERNYAEARQAITATLQLPQDDLLPADIFEVFVAKAEGNAEKARAAFLAARQGYETRLRAHPGGAWFFQMAALVDAALGDQEEAVRKNQRATELVLDDPLEKPHLLTDLAIIYCWTGERDRALALLEDLAEIPNGVSYGELKLDPAWDSLRGDPRFEKTVAALDPKLAR